MKKKELLQKMLVELRFNFQEYDDDCGSVNHHLLAEDFAERYNLGRKRFDVPEFVLEAAEEAAQRILENKLT